MRDCYIEAMAPCDDYRRLRAIFDRVNLLPFDIIAGREAITFAPGTLHVVALEHDLRLVTHDVVYVNLSLNFLRQGYPDCYERIDFARAARCMKIESVTVCHRMRPRDDA